MRHLYPESLADKSFDNTGLLLEAPIPTQLPRKSNSVLLTIDLTKAVADEAIQENHSAVVAYHPIIFRGLKSITLQDPQQQTLLRLGSHGVSVYCPHTAVDIVPGGMADWLCDIVTGKIDPSPEPTTVTSAQAKEQSTFQQSEPVSETDVTTSEEDEPVTPEDTKEITQTSDPFTEKEQTTPKAQQKRPNLAHRTYSKPSYPSRTGERTGKDASHQRTPSPIQSSSTTTFHHDVIPHKRSVITASPGDALRSANNDRSSSQTASKDYYDTSNTGSGRLITFDSAQPLAALITRIAHATGTPKGFPVAIPQDRSLESIRIKTVGICPGSGSSVIRNAKPPPDLVFTGEMSHHEALAVIERGGCVVCLFHSNSERGYLDGVMKGLLEEELGKQWQMERETERDRADDSSTEVKEILADESVSVVVSGRDRDPFGIVVLQESSVPGEVVG